MDNVTTNITCHRILGCPASKCPGFPPAACGPWYLTIILQITGILALLFNILHFCGITWNPSLVRTNHGKTVRIQAVVDAFTGLMVAVATNCTLQENILLYQRLCGFTLWLSGYPTLLSAYILTLISIDRAHCVMSSPLADRSQKWFSKKYTITLLLLILGVTVILILLYVIDVKYSLNEDAALRPCQTGYGMCVIPTRITGVSGIGTTIMIFVPIGIMIACYSIIIWRMRQTTIRIRNMPTLRLQRLQSSIRSIGFLCLAFCVSYLPVAITKLFRSGEAKPFGSASTFIAIFFLFLSSLLNPIVYIMSNRQYRNHLVRCVMKVTIAGEETEGDTGTRSQTGGSRVKNNAVLPRNEVQQSTPKAIVRTVDTEMQTNSSL